MDVDLLEKINGYDKGDMFAWICESVAFEMRSYANIDNSDQYPEQAEEIASPLTETRAADIADTYSPRSFAEMARAMARSHVRPG
eukprot:8667364-Pyramimonas_sp.AAC.1